MDRRQRGVLAEAAFRLRKITTAGCSTCRTAPAAPARKCCERRRSAAPRGTADRPRPSHPPPAGRHGTPPARPPGPAPSSSWTSPIEGRWPYLWLAAGGQPHLRRSAGLADRGSRPHRRSQDHPARRASPLALRCRDSATGSACSAPKRPDRTVTYGLVMARTK